MKIRKGDTVKVLYGKDAGKTGEVLKVFTKESKVVVKDINKFKKHVKGDGQTKSSEVITIVKPLHVSKVQLVDPTTGKASRVRYEIKDGKKSRFALKSGKVIETKKAEVVKEAKEVKTAKKSPKVKKEEK